MPLAPRFLPLPPFLTLTIRIGHGMNLPRLSSQQHYGLKVNFLVHTGNSCTPLRQEFILLSDVLCVSAVLNALNDLAVRSAMASGVLGFFTDDVPDGQSNMPSSPSPQLYPRLSCTVSFPVPLGELIASEGNGEYMFFEGRMLTSRGEPRSGGGYRDVGDGRQG